jgi:microcin C transport system permease protein|tara:strand:+ start:576 stop:1619 length:1044 start_codon:yes stop_codon:yes gene_type:complete
MRAYFLRRLLLIPPTLLGITLIVFAITRFVPGGPVEQRLLEMQGGATSMEGSSASNHLGQQAVSEAEIERLRAYYGLDKPWYIAYVNWLGKVGRGDLGESYRWNEPVTRILYNALPISTFYGIISFILIYSISIPLGMVKALRHRTFLDSSTSILVFAGYAIPGYVLGAILIFFFSIQKDWFPSGGFVGYEYQYLMPFGVFTDGGAILSLLHHAVLPLICYLIGGFALTTLLMKNHLMDNLAADYMRTAVSKGSTFKRAVFKHALRNSLIPIATTFGQNLALFVSGSFLIEFLFDINGFGLLGLESILQRDYPIVMGIVLFSSLLMLVGNIISDILVAIVDPRVRFN